MAVTKEQVLKIADIVTKNNLSVKRPANSIAVDTLSRPADERVDRSVGIVNDFQTRNASPALTNGIRNAVSTTPPSQPDAQRQMLSDLEAEIRGASVAEERQKAFSDAGLVQKEERARTLSNQLVQRERDFQKQREELELNKKGKGEIAYNADLARFDREFSRTLADMAINYQVALGDYNAAQELVNQYVADYQTDLQNRQNSWQMLYNLYQNDMTESEQIQAQQNFQKEQTQTQFEMQQKMAVFQAQLAREQDIFSQTLRSQLSAGEAPKIYNVNGVDSVYDSTTGTFRPVPVEVSQEQQIGELTQSKSKVDQLTNLTQMSGIGSAVGTSIITRAPGGFLGTVGKIATIAGIPGLAKDAWSKLSGSQQNFISEVEQIRSQLNLDTLVNAKKNGATFGALSNQELQVLASAATKLGTWAIVDKNGKVVGYNASQKDFKQELDKINNFAKIDYLLRGGNPEDVGVQFVNGQYVTKNSDGTITVLE